MGENPKVHGIFLPVSSAWKPDRVLCLLLPIITGRLPIGAIVESPLRGLFRL
ncbi:hypothetical protein NBRC3257_1961 [Gluconobacter thailandicus NBRC 3257]|uniref:Uncharacterized protein n=1 Tax=Gluconobacter thailandicus NBRC 3257 TaxID=1381097 RepID=A0ABQ0IXM1_GLUTH|nr:hypothetical protein NBRC3255_1098 [Gluconobacter thailandicus NBRC 3255]GAD26962.1 hypothetical protein NBRC3257_1961 [Gluconobacter thailandicus NBRC 3257]